MNGQFNPATLAEVALNVMAEAPVKADDATLESVVAARQLLHAIRLGHVLVVQKPEPRKAPPAGAEGVQAARPPIRGGGYRGEEGIIAPPSPAVLNDEALVS